MQNYQIEKSIAEIFDNFSKSQILSNKEPEVIEIEIKYKK